MGRWNFNILAEGYVLEMPSEGVAPRKQKAPMQDLAAILSDIISYMTAGRWAKSRAGRWSVGLVFVALVLLLGFVMYRI